MESEESLPIILVSAADVPTADKFITELIGEEEVRAQGAGPGQAEGLRVWQLHNKYYRARVALRPDAGHAGDASPALLSRVDAHLVLLAPHETQSGTWLERRVTDAGAGRARVRLALGECGDCAGGWAGVARALRYEPVPLRPGGAGGAGWGEGEEGARGVDRVREALHAHTWRSLRLHGDGPHPRTGSSSESSSRPSDEEQEEEQEWSEWQSAALTRRRAAQFAAALGALAGAGAGRAGAGAGRAGAGRAGAGAGEGDTRLLRAEALLAALARPLPRPPPPPPPT